MMNANFHATVCLQCWENGIILCRKIAEQYESYYDYRNLSKMRVKYLGICDSGVVPLCDYLPSRAVGNQHRDSLDTASRNFL